MRIPPPSPGHNQRVWFSPLLLTVALSPVFLQTSTPLSCKSGDTTLSALSVNVDGEEQIAFDKNQRTYDAWLPPSASTALVRATSTDPAAQVWVDVLIGSVRNRIVNGAVGGAEVYIPLEPGLNTLQVWVRAPKGASDTYTVAMQVGCGDCSDGNECTVDTCDPVLEMCAHSPEPDDTACDFDGEIGTCVTGACEMGFPCTEQGILDAIALGGGPHTFACNGPTTVVTQDEIIIDNDVILDGEGNLTIDGNDDHRVLSVVPGATAELVGVTISGGFLEVSGSQGVGILNEGTLTITSGVIASNNVSVSHHNGVLGGGIYNSGTLTLDGTAVQDNKSFVGSGIYSTGTLTLRNSRLSGNSGFAEPLASTGTLTLIDSEVSDNEVGDATTVSSFGALTLLNSVVIHSGFGAVFSGGTAIAINTTLHGSGNGYPTIEHSGGTFQLVGSTVIGESSSAGAIRIRDDAVMSISNSLILGNTEPRYPTCAVVTGSLISEGGNIESPTNDCGLTDPTDLVNVTPAELNLGPLADNGGPTQTHALLPGSVAIDRISPSMCVDADGEPLTTDQRGVARPQGSACDVGAFEYADCSGSACDDGNDCTADYCDPNDASWCEHTTLPDGSFCGADGVCEVGACRERSWGTAELIETNVGDVSYPEVAVDPSGNAVAVWPQSDGTRYNIWANRYTPSGGWGTAEPIETNTGDVRYPQVAVDPSGNAVAVWEQLSDGPLPHYFDIWANHYTPGGGWGTPVLIDNATLHANRPEVAVDPSGNAVAVWEQLDGTRYDVWANHYTPGGGWGTAVLIETNPGAVTSYDSPQVALDPSGNAVAVWEQRVGSLSRIWANRYTPSGGWGTAVLIESEQLGNAVRPRVAVDPSGNTVAVWQQHEGGLSNIWANRYTPSGGWGTAVLTHTYADTANWLSFAQVAVDGSGNAVAMWRQVDYLDYLDARTYDIWVSHYTPNDGWGTPVLVDNENLALVGFGYNSVAFDASGSAVAVWLEDYRVWSNRYTPSGGWGTPVLTGSESQGVSAPQVGVDASGNAVAVWLRGVQRENLEIDGDVWANRFE